MLQQCMHCGMCLPTCPTYDSTLRERHSPRGRIALMRAVAEDELPLTPGIASEMDFCLGCLACQSACPAGVDYAELFETARTDIESSGVHTGTARKFWRWLTLKQLFMKPRLLRAAGSALRVYQATKLDRVIDRFLPSPFDRLAPQAPRIAPEFSHQCIDEHETPTGEALHRVALLTGCVQDLAFSDVNRDTADVLLANGCAVHTPPVQPCCGSLHAHSGARELSRTLARRLIDLLPPGDYDAVISNAGGCGSHLRHFGRLLADDPDYAERAREWDTKLQDIHEWLVKTGCRAPRSAPAVFPVRLAYHDSCHLAHGQKITTQPRALLKLLPGTTWCDLPESTWCCGSAGVYNITQPEQSDALLERKVRHIIASGANVLATANPGCMLQVERGLAAAGTRVDVVHPVTLLARAYRNEPS